MPPNRKIIPRMVTKDMVRPQASPMFAPPARMKVRRNPNGGAPIFEGVGDYAQQGEPHQNYWQILDKNMRMPPQRPVIIPPVPMDPGQTMNNNALAKAICECMACTVIQTKAPNWVEPPSSALMVDQSTTADGIPIPAGAPGAFTEVLRITVPDRWYLVISNFGNALEDDVAFQNVDWQIRINDRAMPFAQYLGGGSILGGIFSAQLGEPQNPTKLAMPIIAKYGDTVITLARSNNGAAHNAFARMMGWMYPISMIDGAGDPCSPTGMIPLWQGGATPVAPIIT
jgi:hypothetical protein